MKGVEGKNVKLSRGNGYEDIPVADAINLDGVDGKTAAFASTVRNYQFTVENGVVVKMVGLVGAQGYTSYVSNTANGKFIVTNLKKDAAGYHFDLKNDVKGDANGLTLAPTSPCVDTEGKTVELKEGDIIGGAVAQANPTELLMVRLIAMS